ncbi:MAG: sigma-54-dependent transcriptional regulator [Desulfococcaceae bacterium]
MANVLIIDDDPATCKLLTKMVERLGGHTAAAAQTLRLGLAAAEGRAFDAVFLDVRLPDGCGLDLVARFRDLPSRPEVVIITGYGDQDGAEMAVKNGAWDYIQKPFSPEKILLTLNRVLQYREDLRQTPQPARALQAEGLIGSSSQMRTCRDFLARAANSEANTLITGETGTGKELFARIIHTNSGRADKSFVVVDCAALPETLVESALFGHERGAFTGADRFRMGLIEQAHGGILFLDEIGELPLAIQKSFLRFLQERRFRPVGGKKEVRSDFRLIAATNRSLSEMVHERRFREDLLHRLRALTFEIPPLRVRKSDIKELAVHYMSLICDKYEAETKGFSPDFFEALHAYDWPGNVRELINTLEGVFAETRYEPTLFPQHLPERIRVQMVRSSVQEVCGDASFEASETDPHRPASAETPPAFKDYRDRVLAEAETAYLRDLMAYTQGSIKEACRISGMGRTTLYNLMKKYNISRMGWS